MRLLLASSSRIDPADPTASPAELPRARAGAAKGGEQLPGCVEHLDAAVVRIRHVDRARGAHRHAAGTIEHSIAAAAATGAGAAKRKEKLAGRVEGLDAIV